MSQHNGDHETCSNLAGAGSPMRSLLQGLQLHPEVVTEGGEAGGPITRTTIGKYANETGIVALSFSVEGPAGGSSTKWSFAEDASDADRSRLTVVAGGVGRLAITRTEKVQTRHREPAMLRSLTLVALSMAAERRIDVEPGSTFWLSVPPGVSGASYVVAHYPLVEQTSAESSVPDAGSAATV